MYRPTKILILVVLISVAYNNEVGAKSYSKISTQLFETFQKKDTAAIFLDMKDGTSGALEKIRSTQHLSRSELLVSGAKLLQTHAQESQSNVKSFLDAKGIQYKSYWISNQIYIPQGSLSLVNQLADLDDIFEISEEQIVPIGSPIDAQSPIQKFPNTPREVQWGVSKIQADLVWELVGGTTGEGIVVGNIDTGVRWTHQDLRDSFRADHGWRDPIEETELPNDSNGHGSHTMGILVGANGIGVAPGAQWIACKGCGAVSCSSSNLIECGEFMTCPTLADGTSPDCSLAPQIVSNSWGGGAGSSWFDPILNAWVVLGIYPFFSVGNSGPACSTAGSPADRNNAIAVGTTLLDDSLLASSSRGPSNGLIKPEISAPGQNIVSAWNTADDAYATLSGSSMASPHAAGTGALILSARLLPYNDFKNTLFNGSDTDTLTPPGTNCGGIEDTEYPNNAYGHGRVNAYTSVLSIISSRK